MEVTPAEAEKIVSQVQVAHRLLAGYYQRILGRLDAIGAQLGMDYLSWDPLVTDRPCRSSTQPGKKWVWDLLPLYAFSYTFRRATHKTTRRGDFVVDFSVYTDGAFEKSERKKARINGCPDPFTMPHGEGYVLANVYRYVSDARKSWDAAWYNAAEPDASVEGWQDVGEGFEACSKRVPLAELISNPESVVRTLERMVGEPAQITVPAV